MVGEDGPSRPPRARSSAIMAGPDLDILSGLMDEAKCFALVRRHRWRWRPLSRLRQRCGDPGRPR